VDVSIPDDGYRLAEIRSKNISGFEWFLTSKGATVYDKGHAVLGVVKSFPNPK